MNAIQTSHYEIANFMERLGFEVQMDSDDNELSYVAVPGQGEIVGRVFAEIRGDADAKLVILEG